MNVQVYETIVYPVQCSSSLKKQIVPSPAHRDQMTNTHIRMPVTRVVSCALGTNNTASIAVR